MTQFLSDEIRTQRRSIVADQTFILATRDTGYRDVAAAVAELIDNSLQAGARRVQITVREEPAQTGRAIMIGVLDDGHGMDADTLQTALQFGGTERFDDRSGLGRFGMGLPNSSVSQARRLDVFTWRDGEECLHSYLDIDEVTEGRLHAIPCPAPREMPAWAAVDAAGTGTLVLWTRCDRLVRHRAATIAQRLRNPLGRIYRYAIWQGVRICVNGVPLTAVDPLFVHARAALHGATLYGSPLKYEFTMPDGSNTSIVEVRFAELPVDEWYSWTAEAKRRSGVVGGAGVSIVRAGREIDYGWHLMGGKRRENYDDWWRCEVRFSPALDEFFGVTHSKQGIAPSSELRAILGPDLEVVARELNARVRAAFERVKSEIGGQSRAARVATAQDRFLPPVYTAQNVVRAEGPEYRIQAAGLRGPEFYQAQLIGGTIILTLNKDHPFFTQLYQAACSDPTGRERFRIECLLLALARAEVDTNDKGERAWSGRLRRSWSDALAAFLDC